MSCLLLFSGGVWSNIVRVVPRALTWPLGVTCDVGVTIVHVRPDQCVCVKLDAGADWIGATVCLHVAP